MNILHYSLGFPPYRSGGLTKCCMDLMRQQINDGHNVSLIWPGEMCFFIKRSSIKQRKSVLRISSYEIINPTPIPYDEGICDIDKFVDEGSLDLYRYFFEKRNFDVLHIHTLMGLHKNLIIAAKEAGLRIVYSAHDFYPICAKVTLFKNNEICKNASDCSMCPACNNTALSINKIKILQSPVYRKVKNNKLIAKVRQKHRAEYLAGSNNIDESIEGNVEKYIQLRHHFLDILNNVDIIHYNSQLTKDIYIKYLPNKRNQVLPISHMDIKDNRYIKQFDDKLTVTYLGGNSYGKGFYLVFDAVKKLYEDGLNIELNIYFKLEHEYEFCNQYNKYSYKELNNILGQADVVIAPSIFYETFGYTVLEALSYAVPVIISKNVGARDIIPIGGGIVLKECSVEYIMDSLKQLDRSKLMELNKNIVKSMNILTMEKLASMYYEKLYIGE